MAIYRSALGKTIDMASLASRNERTRAAGNMKVNARGDTIDGLGRIITPATDKVNERYSKTVGNRSAQPVKNTVPQKPIQPSKPVISEELTQVERELEDSFNDDLEIEQIKAQELKNK